MYYVLVKQYYYLLFIQPFKIIKIKFFYYITDGVYLFFFQTPRTYSANNIDDLTEVILHIKKKYPDTILGGIGVSMGG